jgi:hypothetical protein
MPALANDISGCAPSVFDENAFVQQRCLVEYRCLQSTDGSLSLLRDYTVIADSERISIESMDSAPRFNPRSTHGSDCR